MMSQWTVFSTRLQLNSPLIQILCAVQNCHSVFWHKPQINDVCTKTRPDRDCQNTLRCIFFLVHWFASLTANQNDQMALRASTPIQHVESAEKKPTRTNFSWRPTAWNTLKKLSRPINKNYRTADRRFGVFRA